MIFGRRDGTCTKIRSIKCKTNKHILICKQKWIEKKNEDNYFAMSLSKKLLNLRMSRRHGKLNVAGNEKSPLNTAERSAGTVAARKGIFPITIKYNKTPNAHTSTGPPIYESSLNTKTNFV